MNNIYILRREIEKLIAEYFPLNKLVEIPRDLFWCKFLIFDFGIYLLFNGKNIIYIGMSGGLGARLNQHFNKIDYGEKIDRIGIIKMDVEWYDCLAIEAKLIDKFNPYYNKKNPYLHYRDIPKNIDVDKIISQIEKMKRK